MDDLSKKAVLAKDDDAAFELLVKENKSFILSCAYEKCHHFITRSDDEWSIALMAFHEAVRGYDDAMCHHPS